MSTLNVNVPRFYCFLRKQFLYDGEAHQGEFIHACVFGAASIQGRALGFHVLTENGAVIWRVPLHALCHRQEAPTQPPDWLQFWDCFSYEVTATTFDRLQDSRVRVQFKDRSWEGGQYGKKRVMAGTNALTWWRSITATSRPSRIIASNGFAPRS